LTRVLIIDDDLNMTGVLEVALREAGYNVVSTNTGAQGLQLVQQNGMDVVILDLLMPEMDGWATCRAIRSISKVPILILSVINKPELVARALDDGADDYLVKPVPLTVLIAHLKTLARRAHPDTALNGVK
jgi:DNA-binding response OmpR family regulator